MTTEVNTLKWHLKQVARMGGLRFPPQTPEALSELAKVLQRCSDSQEHAERIISRWLETESQCPTPAELNSFAGSVTGDPALDRPLLPAPCAECEPYNGTHRVVSRKAKYGEIVEGLDRCTCPRGIRLRALEKAYAVASQSRTRGNHHETLPPTYTHRRRPGGQGQNCEDFTAVAYQ